MSTIPMARQKRQRKKSETPAETPTHRPVAIRAIDCRNAEIVRNTVIGGDFLHATNCQDMRLAENQHVAGPIEPLAPRRKINWNRLRGARRS